MFKNDKTVSTDMVNADIRSIGSGENTSISNSKIDNPEAIPVMPISETKNRVLNRLAIAGIITEFFVSNLSFTQNWPQLEIIVIAATPAVIQCAVSIIMLFRYFKYKDKAKLIFFKT